VDYAAELGAVAEVNSTASLVASASAKACGSTASNASALAQLCSEEKAQISAAADNLRLANSYLMQTNGGANASVNLSKARTLVGMARAEVSVAWQDLSALASYTYTARGSDYVSGVILPISAQANATIRSEETLEGNITRFQESLNAYATSQTAAALNVTSSMSALATAVSAVDTGAVTSNISASESTAAMVKSDMNSLLNIQGVAAIASLVADIKASNSTATSYDSALVSAGTESATFTQVQLASFGQYLGTMDQDAATVASGGSDYFAAYSKVVSDLNSPIILSIPGVMQIYVNLTGLNVSGNVTATDAALQLETSAMAKVDTGITAASSAVVSARSAIEVDGLNSTAVSISMKASAFLNSTAMASVSTVVASVQALSVQADSFIGTAANATSTGTIGRVISASIALDDAFGTLGASTKATITSAMTAAAYVSSDTSARITEEASARAEVTAAFRFFSNQEVAEGVAAMAQASLYLQAASSASV
jgi:hypothetical protein